MKVLDEPYEVVAGRKMLNDLVEKLNEFEQGNPFYDYPVTTFVHSKPYSFGWSSPFSSHTTIEWSTAADSVIDVQSALATALQVPRGYVLGTPHLGNRHSLLSELLLRGTIGTNMP